MAAGLAPSNQFESAIAATLPPGLYTALLSGVGNATGRAAQAHRVTARTSKGKCPASGCRPRDATFRGPAALAVGQAQVGVLAGDQRIPGDAEPVAGCSAQQDRLAFRQHGIRVGSGLEQGLGRLKTPVDGGKHERRDAFTRGRGRIGAGAK